MSQVSHAAGEAPLHDVVRVVEMPGPRGALHLVHILECGCWVIRGKKPRKKMRCISCGLRPIDVGAPRPMDLAWQAFQAGVIHARTAYCTTDRINAAFREWWSKR